MERVWDRTLISEFDHVKLKDEEIKWAGRPVKQPYLFDRQTFSLLFSIVMFATVYFTFISVESKVPVLYLTLISLFTFGQVVYLLGKKLLSYKHTVYAYTNKRILIRTGIRGNKLISIDYDKIKDILVHESFVEKKYKTGSVRFYSGETVTNDNSKDKIYDAWAAIEEPYKVFRVHSKSPTFNLG